MFSAVLLTVNTVVVYSTLLNCCGYSVPTLFVVVVAHFAADFSWFDLEKNALMLKGMARFLSISTLKVLSNV